MTDAKILVVEDDGIIALFLKTQLIDLGYTVVGTAATGDEAVALAGETRPDLVLMDIVLKGDMDGVEAAGQIKERFQIPVIYVTAYGDAPLLARARITEPNGYLLKPINERELRAVIEMALYKHQAETEMRRAKEAAEAASRAKSEFLANISHEMRTPLNAVVGFSQVLEGGAYGALNEKQLEYLAIIRSSGQHLLTMITDVLELAQVEFGEKNLHLNTFAVADLLNASLGRFKEEAEARGLTLALEPGADNLEVEANLEMLKKVFSHLVGNAVKFTPDGGQITVQARTAQGAELQDRGPAAATADLLPETEYLQVTVADTGIGIQEEDLPKIFAKFTQLETPYTKQYAGIGLGLALVKALVEQHRGRVWVESRYGEGSRFTVVLPVRQP